MTLRMMGETVLLLVGAAATGQLSVDNNIAVKSFKKAIHENFVQILNLHALAQHITLNF